MKHLIKIYSLEYARINIWTITSLVTIHYYSYQQVLHTVNHVHDDIFLFAHSMSAPSGVKNTPQYLNSYWTAVIQPLHCGCNSNVHHVFQTPSDVMNLYIIRNSQRWYSSRNENEVWDMRAVYIFQLIYYTEFMVCAWQWIDFITCVSDTADQNALSCSQVTMPVQFWVVFFHSILLILLLPSCLIPHPLTII